MVPEITDISLCKSWVNLSTLTDITFKETLISFPLKTKYTNPINMNINSKKYWFTSMNISTAKMKDITQGKHGTQKY